MQSAANPFRARFFSFWVVRKLATVNSEPSKSYQTGVTCGRPFGRTVARAATCGWPRKAFTSAEITVGILTPGAGAPAFYRVAEGGVKRPHRARPPPRGGPVAAPTWLRKYNGRRGHHHREASMTPVRH